MKKIFHEPAIWWLRAENAGIDMTVACKYASDVYFNGVIEIRDKLLYSVHVSPACCIWHASIKQDVQSKNEMIWFLDMNNYSKPLPEGGYQLRTAYDSKTMKAYDVRPVLPACCGGWREARATDFSEVPVIMCSVIWCSRGTSALACLPPGMTSSKDRVKAAITCIIWWAPRHLTSCGQGQAVLMTVLPSSQLKAVSSGLQLYVMTQICLSVASYDEKKLFYMETVVILHWHSICSVMHLPFRRT